MSWHNGRHGVYLAQRKTSETSFELSVHGQVVNESKVLHEGEVLLQLKDQEGQAVFEAKAPLMLDGVSKFEFRNVIDSPILWNGIINPYLYTAAMSVISDGQVRDTRNIAIGFRTIEATAEQGLILNGKPVKLNGVMPPSRLRQYWKRYYENAHG